MKNCTSGEIFQQFLLSCYSCDKNTYIINENKSLCLDCPKVGAKKCEGGDKIQLESGYWRSSYQSDLIAYCLYAPQHCKGGNLAGNESCTEGSIGPLCE